MLRLTFLGTSAAQPTIGRNLSSLAIRRERELFLVDCGEGTQRQMIRYGTGFDVGAICFTHLHLDHWLGVVGFLRTLSMQGRPEPLDLFGPRGLARVVERYMAGGIEQLSFDLASARSRPASGSVAMAASWSPSPPVTGSRRSAGPSSRTAGPVVSTPSGRRRWGWRRGRSSGRCSAASRSPSRADAWCGPKR